MYLISYSELQHTRPPCSSPTPGAYSDSCPLSQYCHPTISSSVVPFSSHPQSFPASGSFPMSRLFESGGQSVGASFLASVLPMNTQDWFPLGWTGWISLQSKGLFKSLLQHHSSKASILQHSAFFIVQLSHPYMTTGKTIALTRWAFAEKVMHVLISLFALCSSPKYSLEGLMLKLKLQFFGYLMWRTDSLEKTLMQGKFEGRRRGEEISRGWDG